MTNTYSIWLLLAALAGYALGIAIATVGTHIFYLDGEGKHV